MQTRRTVSEWLYFRAYPKAGFDGLEYLIIQTLPQVLQCDGFDRWFFLRFIDTGGLHLRLRLRTTSAYADELKRTVMPILQHGVERSGKVARHTYRPTIVPPREAAKVYTDAAIPASSLVTSSSHVNNLICEGVEQLCCLDACRMVIRRGAMGG